ncbi:MAG TPA: Gfo/Idh/MocA family oxidoreductase [Opitutaceae bacterium]|nr:Gfo/Idh/MocA family oxidoreductase [Opitutaceae bacterium]
MKKSTSSPSTAKVQPRKVRYALIGLGYIAQAAVLPGFAQAKNSELVALISGDDEKLTKLKQKYKIPNGFSYDQFDDCLKDESVEAVYIALPNDMHSDCCLRAIDAGKHVLCEKPLALTTREAETMIRAAERQGVKLMTAYRLHFEPANLAAIELVRSGKLGEPRIFSSTFTYNLSDRDNIRLHWKRGGGPLYDLGTYCINAARYMIGSEPFEVSAVMIGGQESRFEEVEEAVSAILRFPGGITATFTVSFGADHTGRYELVGTKGRIAVDPAFEYAQAARHFVTLEGKTEEKNFPHTDQFGGEIEAFSNYILKEEEPEPSGVEGLADLRVIEGIFRAAETGQTVELPPFRRDQRPEKHQTMEKPATKEPELVGCVAPH